MENLTPKIKLLYFILVFTLISQIESCKGSTSNLTATAEGFKNIENELIDKFGKSAYYTDLTITNNELIGNIVGVTVTENPESLKMGQWNLTQDIWKQLSDVTITVPTGTKAMDYMFQLNETVSLYRLGALVEQSIDKLKAEKNLNNPTMSIAGLNFPDNGDISKAQYMINIEPENGGTTFSFYYTLNGDLIDKNY